MAPTSRLDSLLSPSSALPSTPASFKYIRDSPAFLTEKPYFYQGPLEPDEEKFRTNVEFETHHVEAQDLRDAAEFLSLKRHGVQICRHPSSWTDDLGAEEGLRAYLTETNAMIKGMLQADVVICYDVKFRQSRPGPAEVIYYDKSYLGSHNAPDDPAWQAHLDSTLEGGRQRVQRHLTEAESEEFFSGRWRVQIFNVWRPLHRPVEQAPLAFCDRTSVKPADLVAVERPSVNRIGHVSFLKFDPEQRWYWISKQDPEEVTIFLSWDSDAADASEFIVHGSFQLDGNHATRESIEARTIVITKKSG